MIFNLTQPVLDSAPKFTYTGTYEYIDDGGGNWRIKFLSSGVFTPLKAMTIDAFLVGGGGSGAVGLSSGVASGGGGGYTETFKKIELTANTEYYIEIGAGGYLNVTSGMNKLGVTGGTTKAFGKSVPGGNGGGNNTGSLTHGGDGGSGGGAPTGSGGVNGSDGTGANAGSGQGKTTREFGEESGELYSRGGNGDKANPSDGNPNTGDGGGGKHYYSIKTSSGGSGIVIIRKHKEAAA